jgi:hypothetical protein
MPHSFPIDPDNSSRARRRAKSGQFQEKSLGARIGDVAFDPNAEDGDGDGLVQDSSVYERPYMPSVRIQSVTTGNQDAAENIDESRRAQRIPVPIGMRSVDKPKGGTTPSVRKIKDTYPDGSILETRDIFPHPSETSAINMNWLKDMSDDEIAEAVVPTSVEDMAAMIIQNTNRHLLVGRQISDQERQDLFELSDVLEKYSAPADLVARIRRFAYQEYSREGNETAEELRISALTWMLDAAQKNLFRFEDVDALNKVDSLEALVISDNDIYQHITAEYMQVIDFLRRKGVSYGHDFSPEAIEEAKRIVKESLDTSDSFSWAVRTYGMPPVRVITQDSYDKAKGTTPQDDVRANELKQQACAWYSHAGHFLFELTLNMTEETMMENVKPGPSGHVDIGIIGVPGFPSYPIPHNVSASQADVLRHEWGHFFYFMFTRRDAVANFVRAGWDRSEFSALAKEIRRLYDAGKGKVLEGASPMHINVALPSSFYIRTLEDPMARRLIGISDEEADRAIKKSLFDYMTNMKDPVTKELVYKREDVLNPNGSLTPVAIQKLDELRNSQSAVVKNELYNPWAAAAEISQNQKNRLTMSVYALTNPQENWAEGVASFMSELSNVRSLSSKEQRNMIARALGIEIDKKGKHAKPWKQRTSGLRSSTVEPSEAPPTASKRQVVGNRRTSMAGKDIERIFNELKLTDEEKEIARTELMDSAEEFFTGAIFDRPIHQALENDRERLLKSIRIEVGEDGVPMIMADPNPLFFQFIPDKRDWSKVRLPSSEAVKKVKKILLDNQNPERRSNYVGATWFSLYSEILDRVTSIPGAREHKPKNNGNFLELYVAGLNDPSETLVGEAQDIYIHDSFGHVGIGRGFDRHGEWANFLSTVSVVKAATEEQMSNEEKEEALRNSFINYGLTQLTRIKEVDWAEWQDLVYGYDGNILDIIELLDESDRAQVLNNDGSRPAGMRSSTNNIVPFTEAPKSMLDVIADTDALRNKKTEVLRGEIVDFADVQRRRENREKIDSIPEIEEYSQYMSQMGAPIERIREITEILEDAAIRNFDSEDDLEKFLNDVRERILSMLDRGLFKKGKNEKRSRDAEDWWYSQEAIERLTSKVLTSVLARDVEDIEKMDELANMAHMWEIELMREVVDIERNRASGTQTKSLWGDMEIKTLNYTKPELRERLKRRIMAGDKGGRPGQWSARKAQLLAQQYREAGGGYRGGLRKTQRSLKRWTREKWTTSDGKPANRPGGMRRYLPAKAWRRLTPAQRAATNRKKIEGSRRGRQFVANTAKARTVGRNVRKSS